MNVISNDSHKPAGWCPLQKDRRQRIREVGTLLTASGLARGRGGRPVQSDSLPSWGSALHLWPPFQVPALSPIRLPAPNSHQGCEQLPTSGPRTQGQDPGLTTQPSLPATTNTQSSFLPELISRAHLENRTLCIRGKRNESPFIQREQHVPKIQISFQSRPI